MVVPLCAPREAIGLPLVTTSGQQSCVLAGHLCAGRAVHARHPQAARLCCHGGTRHRPEKAELPCDASSRGPCMLRAGYMSRTDDFRLCTCHNRNLQVPVGAANCRTTLLAVGGCGSEVRPGGVGGDGSQRMGCAHEVLAGDTIPGALPRVSAGGIAWHMQLYALKAFKLKAHLSCFKGRPGLAPGSVC